jgi:hypothetical protein
MGLIILQVAEKSECTIYIGRGDVCRPGKRGQGGASEAEGSRRANKRRASRENQMHHERNIAIDGKMIIFLLGASLQCVIRVILAGWTLDGSPSVLVIIL